MNVFNSQIATTVHLNANYNSPAVRLKEMFMFSVAAIITGTPTGTIALQASNDPDTNPATPNWQPPTHWVTITGSSQALSASGEVLWNVTVTTYNWVRVIYTDGSSGASTATMDIIVNGKG